MKISLLLILSITAITCVAAMAHAQTVNLPVYSTGLNSSGQEAAGSADSDWTVTGGGGTNLTTYVSTTNPSTWIADTSSSKWVSVNANGGANAAGQVYTFSQSFNVGSNSVLSTGQITFTGTSDNQIEEVLLNGNIITDPYTSTNQNNQQFTAMSGPVTVNTASGGLFNYGVNTLTFITLNQANTPEGLDVNIESATITVVPEPNSVVALGIAALLLSCMMMWRRLELPNARVAQG